MEHLNPVFLATQVVWLFLLAIPVACVAWTVTHEEVFSEWKNFCVGRCKSSKTILQRKFFYLFTCEYCFSHYVTIFFLIVTHYKLLFDDWRGYLLAGFAIVWVANLYMSIHAMLRVSLKKERTEVQIEEVQLQKVKEENGEGQKS
jgi:hypothetical protein